EMSADQEGVAVRERKEAISVLSLVAWCPQGARSQGLSNAALQAPPAPPAPPVPSQHTSHVAAPSLARIVRAPRKGAAAARRSRDHDACIGCGTTERPNRANGRCKRCDDRWRYCNR